MGTTLSDVGDGGKGPCLAPTHDQGTFAAGGGGGWSEVTMAVPKRRPDVARGGGEVETSGIGEEAMAAGSRCS